jgi:hypothetical protein
MEIADIGGEFFFRASVGAVRHSKNAIDSFHAGLQEFFGYTVHVIIGFLVFGLCSGKEQRFSEFGVKVNGERTQGNKANESN